MKWRYTIRLENFRNRKSPTNSSDESILWPNPGQTVKLWLNDYWHAAPRIGLAYRLTNTTVIRAGYGIFTVSPNFDQINTLQVNPPTGAAVEAINPTTNPVATIQNPSAIQTVE